MAAVVASPAISLDIPEEHVCIDKLDVAMWSITQRNRCSLSRAKAALLSVLREAHRLRELDQALLDAWKRSGFDMDAGVRLFSEHRGAVEAVVESGAAAPMMTINDEEFAALLSGTKKFNVDLDPVAADDGASSAKRVKQEPAAAGSSRVYAVRKGLVRAIFSGLPWDQVAHAVSGMSGARFKRFSTVADAERYMRQDDAPWETVTPRNVDVVKRRIDAARAAASSTSTSAVAAPANQYDYTVYFDGGSRGNPGVGGCGAILYCRNKAGDGWDSVGKSCSFLGSNVTNNMAEYHGLLLALQLVSDNVGRVSRVAVRGDSQLVIRQVTGKYETRHPLLKELKAKAQGLTRVLSEAGITVVFEEVRREDNGPADRLANQAMDRA
jgi:ribonuclease HI